MGEKELIGVADCEPTWKQMCKMSEARNLSPRALMPACKLADHIRQAQKQGTKRIEIDLTKKSLIIRMVD